MTNHTVGAALVAARPFLAMALLAAVSGCATMGGALQIAGTLTGDKNLQGAGQSMSRAAEVKEFSAEEKYYTGRTVAADLLRTERPSENAALEQYVGKIGHVLAEAAGIGELPQGWHFILIDDLNPNAYACPGGFIFVSKGQVNLCDNEEELAGVLAHEIAHIALDHPMAAISAANQKAAFGALASYGISQATKGSELANLTGAFDNVVKEVGKAVSHGYDRAKEAEADKAAVGMLVEAGYNPRGLKAVLGKLRAGDKSHGDPAKRAEAVEAEAYRLEPAPKTLAARTERFKSAAK